MSGDPFYRGAALSLAAAMLAMEPPPSGPLKLGNSRKQKRCADPAKKAARKRQGAARAKNRKK